MRSTPGPVPKGFAQDYHAQISALKRKHRALHQRWARVYFDHDRSDTWRRALDQIEAEMRQNIEQLKGLRRGH